MNKTFLTCLVFAHIIFCASAQKIAYSQPEKSYARSFDFDIVGKINTHYLIYRHAKSLNTIFLYDNEMKLSDKVNMDFIHDKIISSEIIPYKNHFYFVYQYQKDNTATCAAAKINEDGIITSEPVTLDTTTINFAMSNKIYNVLYSEDKQKILIYRVSNKKDSNYITCSLFNEELKPLDKFTVLIRMQSPNDFVTELTLDNRGTIAFVKVSGNSDIKAQQHILLVKNLHADINSYSLNTDNIYMTDIRIKADNLNNHFLITGFYSNQKKGNIDGLYCAIWSKNNRPITVSKQIKFTDQLKSNAETRGSLNEAFNNYYLQNIVMRKDGGFAIASESVFLVTNGMYNNRLDDFYNAGTAASYDANYFPYTSAAASLSAEYFAYNIAIMSFDSAVNMDWSTVIPKSQYGKDTYNFISYGTYLTPGDVNFFFNQPLKKSTVIQSVQMNALGAVTFTSALRKLDKRYNFMPRFAKQVSNNEVLIPFQYKNNLCFTKIEF